MKIQSYNQVGNKYILSVEYYGSIHNVTVQNLNAREIRSATLKAVEEDKNKLIERLNEELHELNKCSADEE